MNKLRISIVCMALALLTPVAFAGKPDKPGKPPGQDSKSDPATCIMQVSLPLPEGHGYLSSNDTTVEVDRAVQNFGPINQMLFIHKNLLPPDGAEVPTGAEDGLAMVKSVVAGPDLYGPYYGQIRVLDDRIDYFFDTVTGCVQDNTSPDLCPFRLTVVDGNPVYTGSRKNKTLSSIAFRGGRTLLDYRPCDPAIDPDGCYFKLYGCYDDRDCPDLNPDTDFVPATFDVVFQ